MRLSGAVLPTICSSGAAELVGALLYLFGPALAALAGSALTAALTSASVAILVGTLAHAIGLSLALGGHRLRRRGHWLGRPLLFSAAVVVFTLAGFASIGVALGIVTGDSAGWWLTIAPLSALLAQLASVFLGAVWLLGHTGSLLGDWLEQIWTERSETFETRWRRVRTVARWLGVALWLLAALALLAASAFGVVTALALMLVADAARGLLAVHAGLMAVGVVAAFVVVIRQLPRLRNPDPERWVPTLRLRPRDSAPRPRPARARLLALLADGRSPGRALRRAHRARPLARRHGVDDGRRRRVRRGRRRVRAPRRRRPLPRPNRRLAPPHRARRARDARLGAAGERARRGLIRARRTRAQRLW